MTYLTSHLSFPVGPSVTETPSFQPEAGPSSTSPLPPAGSQLLITDTLNSPAHFALYHLVVAAVQAKRPIVWVDFRSEGRKSWEIALKKLGTAIPANLTHISPSPLPPAPAASSSTAPSLYDSKDDLSLDATFESISSATTPGSIVILDGLTELLWLGIEPVTVTRFVRDVLGTCRDTQSSLVNVAHGDHLPLTPTTPLAPAGAAELDLVHRLIRLGGGRWWRISNLASGRSGDVHGEICSFLLVPTSENLTPDAPGLHSTPLQHRLESNTVKVFAKGTGRGFL